MATKEVIVQLKDFLSLVNESGIHLKRVILFGSFANNKQTQNSDIDVALVADEFSGVPSEDVKLFLKALRKHYLIQVQTFNTKYFSKGDPFIEEIIKTGIEIDFKNIQ